MTIPRDAEPPEIPDAVRPLYEELIETVRLRQAALDEVERLSDECKRLDVELLRSGVPRHLLVGLPYSSAWLARIQEAAGVRTRRGPRAS